MQQYVLLGIDADGKQVSLISPNMTLEDIGGYIGRLQASLAIHTAMNMAKLAHAQHTHGASKIVTPGGFKKQ
jgi:succinate-acetate transporter protein